MLAPWDDDHWGSRASHTPGPAVIEPQFAFTLSDRTVLREFNTNHMYQRSIEISEETNKVKYGFI